MDCKRSSSQDCFRRRKLWQHSCQMPVQGSTSSSCHQGPPHDDGGLNSRASVMSSMSRSLVESFDQDSPVFMGSEDRRIWLNTELDLQLEGETKSRGMHEKLKEQWSAGSAERPTAKVSLRRKRALSASCPSLDANAGLSVTSASAADSHLLVGIEDDGMLHRSMHNLSNPVDSMVPSSSAVSFSLPVGLRVSSETYSLVDSHRSTSPFPEISVQICINDVSVDNPEDYHQQMMSDDEDDINVELIRRQKRRSSWCPEQERKKDEKEEKQRMLGINGRSQSLSSLEGQDDTDDSDSDDSTISTHVNVPSKSFAQVALLNDSDIDGSTEYVDTGSPSLVADGFRKCQSEERRQSKHLSTQDGAHDSDDDVSRQLRSLVGDMDSNDDRTTSKSGHHHHRSEMTGNDRTSAKEEHITTKSFAAQSVAVRTVDGCSADDLTNASGSTSPRVERSRSHSEEKTRRRSSVFSKISSYRQNKKVVKGSKLSHNCHQFVSVSVSNSTACDVCGKFLSNKPALQCENCAINVHESSCVDQTQSCARNNRLPSKEENAFIRRESNRVEDENGSDVVDGFVKTIFSGLSSAHTTSHSTESLDEAPMSLVDLEDEAEVVLMAEMAEAWSVTVDKKTLKKMTAKDIKRQDHIWELIATEKNHYRTLKTMQKIFAHGMMKEVGMSRESIDQIFPRLEDLIELHSIILKSFVERQEKRTDRCIEHIGPLLVQLFSGRTGNQMRSVYGEFCSRHAEAVGIYKELRRTDKKFQTFIDKCSHRNICRRLGVDECILLVTQRLTKYPLLIEPIIKTTIDVQERQLLNNALSLIKSIINSVNAQIDVFAKRQRLADILNRLDQKSSTIFRGSKFKKFELLVSDRTLHYEGYVKWMSARGKSSEVLAVVLSDIMFFLTESNQKYHFFSQDGKSSVVSLSKLLVREKDDMRDSRGFYLICSSSEPEMYELICKSTEERSHWIALLKDAIFKCSQDDVGSQTTSSMNGIISNDSSAPKIQQLLDLLQENDRKIAMLCMEKMQTILEMLEAIDHRDERIKLNENEAFDPSHLINAVLQLETRLLVAVKQINALVSQTADLSNSSSEADSAAQPKKRADTFSGFEHKDKAPTERRRNASGYSNKKNCSMIQNGSHELKSLSSGEQPNDNKTFRRASLVITSSLMDTNRTNNNNEKSSRRMSVNILPNMLNKLHRDKETVRPLAANNQSAEKADDWIAPLPIHVPLSADFLSTLVTDQCESLAQIAHHVCSLMSFITKQSTELQSHRVELSGMNQNVSKLFRENDRLQNDRKLTGFQHDKQLEELRNLQTSIEKQKKELRKFRAEQEAILQQERDQLQKKQDDIDRQRAELKTQKDELQRQKDTLQRQIDLFEEQRLNSSRSLTPSTLRSERSESLGARATNNWVPPRPSGSLHSRDSPRTVPEIPDVTAKGTSSGEASHKSEVFIHLQSAANDLRLTPARQRFSSSEVGKPQGPPMSVHQVLPMKLSTRGDQPSANEAHVEKTSIAISRNFSESCISAGANVGAPHSGSSFSPNLYASSSQPQINLPISAIPQHVKSNILPMKLAGKSKSTPSSANSSPIRSVPTSNVADSQSGSAEKHMQKSRIKEESEIIYF